MREGVLAGKVKVQEEPTYGKEKDSQGHKKREQEARPAAGRKARSDSLKAGLVLRLYVLL